MRGRLLIIGAVLAALTLPGSMLCTRAWSAETATVAELKAKVDELSKEVASLQDSLASLRRELEAAKMTQDMALDIVQVLKDNIGKTAERTSDLAPNMQMLSLQVERNRENISLMRDCVIGNWFMSYWAMQRAKGKVEADQKFEAYDKQTASKFKQLNEKFQDRPAAPTLPKALE